MKFKKTFGTLLAVAALMVPLAHVSYANSCGGNRSSGAIFSIYYDSSVASYGYTAHLDEGYKAWNGISSNVKLSKTTSTSGYPDKYYIGNTSDPVAAGQTYAWKKDFWGTWVKLTDKEWNNTNFEFCTVSLYDNNFKKSNYSYANIRKAACHEVGHTLSQLHPPKDILGVKSVMLQGKSTRMVQKWDKESLIGKWGK